MKDGVVMKNKGFTLIELLLVISIIAILSTVVLRLVNSQRTQAFARDGVRASTIQKLVTAIETYRLIEGSYPPSADISNPSSVLRSTYLKDWPTEPAGSSYQYVQLGGGSSFELDVATEATTGCLKYHSDWETLQECTNCAANSTC